MQTKQWIRGLAVLLATVLTITFSGCSKVALLFAELLPEEVQQWATGDALVQTPEMLGLENMKKVASSGGLELYFHETTTEIAIKTADGTVWYSNPQNRLEMNASLLGKYSSPLLLSTIDSADTSKQLNAFDDCVKYGQFVTSAIPDGIRVEYRFGQVIKTPLYPQVLTADRFQELIAQLDKTQQSNMKRYYLEVNYDTVSDQQALKSLEEKYTKIAEVKHIFVLKQSPSALETNRILEYLTTLGYTMEQREQDHAAVGYSDPSKAKGNLLLPVEYTLAGGRLNVRVPTAEIRATANRKLDTVTILPYLCTANGQTSAQGVVPDGSGAILDLSTVKSGNTAEYVEGFYGQDYSLYQTAMIAKKRSLYLPAYGMTAANGAYLAVVTKAAATASVAATAKVSAQDMGSIGARFKLLDYAKVKLTSTDTETVNSYPEQSISDEIGVDFTFLTAEKNRWTDVATAYRSRLQAEKQLDGSMDKQLPVIVNLIGAIEDTVPVLGIPREVLKPLTTFSQATDIVRRLDTLFDGNPLYVRYTGWRSGGIKSSILTGVDAEKKLGGQQGLDALSEVLTGLGGQLFPDADFQYVYRDKWFDGFSSSRDVARFITSEAAFKPAYNKANFLPDADGLYGYILQPNSMAANVTRFLQAAQGKSFSGFSLPYMASDLSGNFDKNNFITRNTAQTYAVEVLQKMQNAGYKLLSSGANAYALPFLDCAVELPLDANTHPLVAQSVPFTQMVLSGSVQYAAEELNKAADDRYYLLKCIESGSALYFSAIAEPNSTVKDTPYSDYYAVNFDTLESRVATVGGELTKALAPVYGSAIVDYRALADGVVQADYANGAGIVVNYNKTEAVTAAGVVPGEGWLHVKAG